MHVPAAFRWSGPGTARAAWVLLTLDSRNDVLKQEIVLPTVAEIVLIFNPYAGPIEVCRHRLLPARQHDWGILKRVLIRNPDLDPPTPVRIVEPKGMQVVLLPAHGVLDCDVQVPQTVWLAGTSIRRHTAGLRPRSVILNLYTSLLALTYSPHNSSPRATPDACRIPRFFLRKSHC
jgi:hypothetical protein